MARLRSIWRLGQIRGILIVRPPNSVAAPNTRLDTSRAAVRVGFVNRAGGDAPGPGVGPEGHGLAGTTYYHGVVTLERLDASRITALDRSFTALAHRGGAAVCGGPAQLAV